MADPYQNMKDNVVFWTARNHKKDPATGTFRTDKSKLESQFMKITYGDLKPSSTIPLTLQNSTFINKTGQTNKQTFTVEKKTTSSFTWTLKESIQWKFGFKAALPIVGEAENEVTLNFEATQSQTTSLDRSWTYSTEVTVAPHKRVEVSFVVNEGKYNVPFYARVQVRGSVFVEFKDGSTYTATIDEMLQAGWNRETFEAILNGTLTAVNGDKFIVRVEDFDIGPNDAAIGAGRARIHDSGVLRDGALHAAP